MKNKIVTLIACIGMCLMPVASYASATVTDAEIWSLFKGLGVAFGFLLIPGFIVMCIVLGVRILRGLFNI